MSQSYTQAFNKLQEYSKDLEAVEYNDIVDLLKNSIRKIPIPLAKLHPETPIERARANKGTRLYKSIESLGYIKDPAVIERNLSSFGRANKPHQVMFYAALPTSQLDKPRITAIAETSRLYLDKDAMCVDGQLYTISRWRNKAEMIIAEVVFSEEAIKLNEDIKRSYDKQREFASQIKGVDSKFFEDFLIFISNEFARVAKSHHEYKLSTAYTNLVLEHKDVQGITYPSVQTNYAGANLVLAPVIVDEYIYPDVATTSILFKNEKEISIRNGGYFAEKLDQEINWINRI